MPVIDFSDVPDNGDYSPLPDGWYECRLENVVPREGKNGEFYSLEFVVEKGKLAGRKIFDSMHFTENALGRVKLICARLGMDVTGRVEISPQKLEGRRVMVQVAGTEEYINKEGLRRERNIVPFAGYRELEDSAKPAESTQDDSNLPF